MRAAIALWVANEVARRWKALVALGVLAGLAGGLAVASVAGARRASTAFERYREATGRADAIVFGTLAGIFPANYTPVRDLPEVEDAGEFTLAPLGVDGFPMLGTLPPNDDRLYRTVASPLLVAGRLPDPARDDELVVNRSAARQLGLGVGDRLTLVSATELDPAAPLGTGPSVEATVVGIGDSAMELIFGGGEEPGFVPSAALLGDHPEIPRAGNLVVRLRPGTDVAEFGRRAAEAMGVPYLPVRDLAEDTKRTTHGTDLERTALLLFAAAVALAGTVLVGQALSRTVYGVAESASPLGALGFGRHELLPGLVLPLVLPAAVGMVTAMGAAVVLSRWFPVGLAGRLEPDPGIHADWLVVAPGAAVVALAVLAGAGVAAVRATSGGPSRLRATSGGWVEQVLRRVAPLPAVLGADLALRRGEGRRALPVRPAIASGVAAVLGVVGAFGLLGGIDDALARPERSGQFWQAEMLPSGGTSGEELAATVAADDQVSEAYLVRNADVALDGANVGVYALVPHTGNRGFTVLEGRPPVATDEIVLGPATSRALGKDIGDTVQVKGPPPREVRVVGLGLFAQTPHFSFDQGAWMSADGFDAVAPPSDGVRDEGVVVRFSPGVPVEPGIAGLAERLGSRAEEIGPASLAQDVEVLRNVRPLPRALAGFLVLLGVGALGHVLAATVRRRRHDLAVLRALGFRPAQVAACVSWQAVTVSVIALVVGIPLGVATGRWAWRWVADATPLLYVPPLAATVVVASVPAALVLAGAVATLPARRAARLRPADVLRAE